MGEFDAVMSVNTSSAEQLESLGYSILGMISIKGELHYVAVKEVNPKP